MSIHQKIFNALFRKDRVCAHFETVIQSKLEINQVPVDHCLSRLKGDICCGGPILGVDDTGSRVRRGRGKGINFEGDGRGHKSFGPLPPP